MERESLSSALIVSADESRTGDFNAIMIGAGFVS